MTMADSLSVVSTFSGPGGSSLGYKRAGHDVLAAVDCAPETFTDYILDTYRANHPHTPLLERDIRGITGDDILDVIGLDVGELDILDGAPPCSPFSTANSTGERGPQHASGTLFDEYARLVDELNPRYFVAENVQKLAEGDTKGYFRDLCTRLETMGDGYDLTVHKLDAAYLGSPHHRRRLIFVGTRRGEPQPAPLEYEAAIPLKHTLKHIDQTREDVRIAREKLDESANAAGYKLIDPGRKLWHVLEHEDRGWTHRRLDLGKPAPNPTSVVELLHPTENRFLTIPELRAIIGLPDDYALAPPDGSFNQQWECAIRCLPPSLLERISDSIANPVSTPVSSADDD